MVVGIIGMVEAVVALVMGGDVADGGVVVLVVLVEGGSGGCCWWWWRWRWWLGGSGSTGGGCGGSVCRCLFAVLIVTSLTLGMAVVGLWRCWW